MAASGKTVLITGGSEGIGRATVKMLAARGDLVIATARNASRLDSLVAECPPGRVVPRIADVADAAQMETMAAAVLAEQGVPDVVVANAGIGLDARVEETSDEQMARVLEINVMGVLRTVRPFVSGMIARGSGRILLISSVVGKRGIPHYTAYSASKFALQGMAEAMRPELAGTGVTVGLIYPSSTESEFANRRLRSGPEQKGTRVARHSAKSVAKAIVSMADSRRREMVLSAEGKAMAWVNKLSPALMDWILARALMKGRR